MDQRCFEAPPAKHQLSTGGLHSTDRGTLSTTALIWNSVNLTWSFFSCPRSWRSLKRNGWSSLHLLQSKPASCAHNRTWRPSLSSSKPKETSLMVDLETCHPPNESPCCNICYNETKVISSKPFSTDFFQERMNQKLWHQWTRTSCWKQ